MTNGNQQALLVAYAMALSAQNSEEKRMETLRRFEEIAEPSIPNWPERLKELLREEENGEAAMETVDRFCGKTEDEDGPVTFRKVLSIGNYQLSITFDRSKPEDEQFTVEECPDLDSMSLRELRKYYSELEDALDEIESEEPDEDDEEEYQRWQEQCDELEELMDDVEEHISKLKKAGQ